MTIRAQVQDEAKKAADAIRAAAIEFSNATGLEMQVDVDYVTYFCTQDEHPSSVVRNVTVTVGGVRATA